MERIKSSEAFLEKGSFSFGGSVDYRIGFRPVMPSGGEAGEEHVEVSISYPFDRDTFEDVNLAILIPRSEFEFLVQALVSGGQVASFSEGDNSFELRRTESGGLSFRIRAGGRQLETGSVIDGLTL